MFRVKPRATMGLIFFTVLIQKSEKQCKVLSGCPKNLLSGIPLGHPPRESLMTLGNSLGQIFPELHAELHAKFKAELHTTLRGALHWAKYWTPRCTPRGAPRLEMVYIGWLPVSRATWIGGSEGSEEGDFTAPQLHTMTGWTEVATSPDRAPQRSQCSVCQI